MSKLLIPANTPEAKRLSSLYKQNKLRRIAQGVYTDDLDTPIELIIQNQWMLVVSHIVPNGILSFRTAVELKPAPYKNGLVVFMTSSYSKTVNLPGLIIKITKGDYQTDTEQVLPYLAKSNTPRMLLENLAPVRNQEYKKLKTIGIDGVERFLTKEMRVSGEKRLNQIKDKAKLVAENINLPSEYIQLKQIISALLATHSSDILKTAEAKAIAKKIPFDSSRIASFEKLSLYLKKCHFRTRPYEYNKASFKNLSFFESYFSNFIEGTEFIINEAENIVFKGTEINNRHADSHDVLSNFNLTNDYTELSKPLQNPEEFLNRLKDWHEILMKERPEINPGEFKTEQNKAGNTYFVEPGDVIGTLTRAYEYYTILKPGLERALFMQFVVSEVHPFKDGNGRLSRILMNAELVFAEQFKIIIPTVHRDNYLNGLRVASRDQNFRIFCKVMDQAQAYTSSINWADYAESRNKIERDSADQTPDEGLPIFYRALGNLELSEFAN